MATNPYLPDIVGTVVGRVDAETSALSVNPFHVTYAKGIYSQVGKGISDVIYANQEPFPLVWLVMPFVEKFGRVGVFADVTFDLIVAMQTDPNWTQDEREASTFKPVLIPVYELLMKQIGKERTLTYDVKQPHSRILRPYWGGADAGNGFTENMFKQFIDAIVIKNISLAVRPGC